MMARHWTESEDTAVTLAAALDYEDGGQRLSRLQVAVALYDREVTHLWEGKALAA